MPAGEWQSMSAGTGIRHSEMNQGDEQGTFTPQIWIIPNEARYKTEIINRFASDRHEALNQWHLICGPNETD